MSDSKQLFISDENINQISISESLANHIIDFMPLIKTLCESISTAKFQPSELSKSNYHLALKNLCSFVINEYSETLRFNRFNDELTAFFVSLHNKSVDLKRREKQHLTAKQEVHEICRRNYEGYLNQNIPAKP